MRFFSEKNFLVRIIRKIIRFRARKSKVKPTRRRNPSRNLQRKIGRKGDNCQKQENVVEQCQELARYHIEESESSRFNLNFT